MTRRALLIALSGLLALVLGGCPGGKKAAVKKTSAKTGKTAAVAKTKKLPPPKPFNPDEVKSVWKHAKVGDYAVYQAVMMKRKFYFKVTEVGKRFVTWIKTDETFEKKEYEEKVDLAEIDLKLKEPADQVGVQKPIKDETFEPKKGDKLECRVITRAAGTPTRNWIVKGHKLMPFMNTLGHPIARSQRGKDVESLGTEFELLEYGNLNDK